MMSAPRVTVMATASKSLVVEPASRTSNVTQSIAISCEAEAIVARTEEL